MRIRMKHSFWIIKIKKRNKISILFVVMLLFLWVLMAYNTSSADIDYYSNIFTRIRSGITYHAVEGGFYYLCKLAVMLGMDYPLFLKIYSAIALLLICSTVLKYTIKPWVVLLFYFCYPFLALKNASCFCFTECCIHRKLLSYRLGQTRV